MTGVLRWLVRTSHPAPPQLVHEVAQIGRSLGLSRMGAGGTTPPARQQHRQGGDGAHRGCRERRNTCDTPWSNRLDIRFRQTIAARGFSADLTVDVINVLNLLDPSWGIVQVSNPVVKLFRVRRDNADTTQVDPLTAFYMGALRRDPEVAGIGVRGVQPFAPEVPTSQWRAQLGLRVRRGG